ncbi:sporulation and spore germination protein [Flavimobilis soli]|uniref:Sporulation and spore germination protein n=1 Tax=Flavimobilis soli TaxID=442709 RepID=A0A2A9EGH7_9MICO|nr:LpqB family beta-propeller domain-containing protein [Flavimobilis soli]PFG37631.1 sporulation and spore germination protein [Flavimobilis soli]
MNRVSPAAEAAATSSRARRSVARGAVAAATALAALAGCASIPTEGPVAQGDVVLTENDALFLQVYGPTADATPEQIVRGFLSAQAAGVNEAFATAREFLTEGARQEWDPYGQVTVYSGDLGLTMASAPSADGVADGAGPSTEQPAPDLAAVDQVVLSGPANIAGVVDVAGQYVEASKDARQDVSFVLAKDAAGQWRIDEVADGVLVSQPNFASVYRSTPVYFLSPDLTTLVPELRWFPQRNIATNAVRALLAGPSEWMRDAVVSGAPAGTALSVEAVAIDAAGTASVDLTGPVLAADEDQRALLSAQLEATLQRISGVSDVALTVGGAALTVKPHSDLERDPAPDGPALGVQAGTLVSLDGRQLSPVVGMPSLAALDPTALAVRGDVVVARLGEERLVRLSTAGEATDLLAEPGLVAPSVDRFGWVWTGSEDRDGTLTAVRASDGTRMDLVVDWLAGQEVRRVKVSRDGARVAVLSAGPEGTQVEVAGIVRDASGSPQRLNAPVPVGGSLASASDAAWVDEVTVAILGDRADGEAPGAATTVALAPVGGQTETLQPVEAAAGVAAGRGKRAVYVRTEGGDLFTRSTTGTNWSLVTTGVDLFTFPG